MFTAAVMASGGRAGSSAVTTWITISNWVTAAVHPGAGAALLASGLPVAVAGIGAFDVAAVGAGQPDRAAEPAVPVLTATLQRPEPVTALGANRR